MAKVTAPKSIDAEGSPVETTLKAEGDVITMHVDHQDEDVAYPIAADPSYEVVYTRWTLGWYPDLRPETYIHHWAVGSSYIGNWHVAYCWHIMYCAPTGGGWHNVIYGSSGYVAYWPRWDWGPVWLQFYYPVYATRMVVARWVPYWTPDPHSAAWVPAYADGEQIYDGGDPDNGDPDAVAAAVRPACKRVRWTNRVIGYGGGHLFYRFCWNRSKVKVSLDSQYANRVESWVSFVGHILGLTSIKTTGERFLPETLSYHGHWRGALDGHAQFKFRGEFGIGPASVGKDLMTVDWGVVAKYDGSICAYQKRERGATCGV